MPKHYLIIGIVVSLALHGAFIAFMYLGKGAQPKVVKRPPMNIVQAKVVQLKAKSKPQAPKKAVNKPNKIDLAAKRKAQEEQKRKAMAAQRHQLR